jgi:hypothetical protein
MRFVAAETADQLDLQALHRVRLASNAPTLPGCPVRAGWRGAVMLRPQSRERDGLKPQIDAARKLAAPQVLANKLALLKFASAFAKDMRNYALIWLR